MTKKKSDNYDLEILEARFELADLLWEGAVEPTREEEPYPVQTSES
jgi:hypothetical protein